MTQEMIIERIAKKWNEHNRLYSEAVKRGDWEEASFQAFMCNAINAEALRSSSPEMRMVFYRLTEVS